MVKDARPLPSNGQHCPHRFLLPDHFQREDYLLGGVGRLKTHKLCVLVHADVGLLLLATTIEDKHFATVLPTHFLVKCWQRIKALSQTLQGGTLSL